MRGECVWRAGNRDMFRLFRNLGEVVREGLGKAQMMCIIQMLCGNYEGFFLFIAL